MAIAVGFPIWGLLMLCQWYGDLGTFGAFSTPPSYHTRIASVSATCSSWGERETYQASPKEKERDSNMFEVLWSPSLTPSRKMLKENVRDSIEENEKALYGFHG
jgi:hypothetical protein